jgi:hypothetical protein
MRARGLISPFESTDVPDALSLTFAPVEIKMVMNNVASAPLSPYYPELGV